MISSLLSVLRGFLTGNGALILPELELLLFAAGIALIDRWLAAEEKRCNAILALAGTAFSAFTLYVQHGKISALRDANPDVPGLLGFHESVLVDPFFLFFAALFLATTALVVLCSMNGCSIGNAGTGSYCAFLLLGCAGMMLMVSGVDEIVVFVGLQLMSASCFVLVRRGTGGKKAARSYAALWACSSVALALGFLLLYGQFRTTSLGRIGAVLDVRIENGVALGGLTTWHSWLTLSFIAAGIFLLMEAAPLHWFSPDVYEHAPAPVAAYFGAAAKTAACALLLRLFSFLFLFAHQKWIYVWEAVAVASLAWGSAAAMRQNNLGRLLAYGSVAHSGFLLLCLAAANERGFHAFVFYTAVYVFSLAGIFGVLMATARQGIASWQLSDLHGLWRRNRAAAAILLLFALSLAGVPPAAGFVGKFYILRALLEGAHPYFAALVVVAAAAAVYYYGRIAASAFQKPAEGLEAQSEARFTIGSPEAVALTVAVFVSLAAGLYPEPFVQMARYAFGQ
ncbi:MAG TPA: proton-conducting transporter membrane subunit [Candidatus Acidoferrum sp.]|nr:proton-conducting transporter membrane subunit [Candidatus Acidoferrum sp.]